MKLRDLFERIRDKKTVVILIDELLFICSAPINSPVFEAYLDKTIAFIDLPKVVAESGGETYGSDYIVTLDVEVR